MSGCPIPDHADIKFAEQTRTGRVHILPYQPEYWEDDEPPVMLLSLGASEQVDVILGRVRVLCGYEGYTAPGGRLQFTGREHFEDDALCIRCVRALGDKSWRAFAAS